MENLSIEEQMFNDLQKAREEKGLDAPQEESQEQEQIQEETQQESSLTDEQTQETTTQEEQTEQPVAEQTQTETPVQETKKEVEAKEQAQQEETQAEPFDVLEYYKEHKADIDLAMRDLESIDYNDTDSVADLLVEQYVNKGYSVDDAYVMLERKFPTMFSEDDIDEDDPEVQKALRGEMVEMKSLSRDYVAELKERQAKIDLKANAGKAPANYSEDSVIENYRKQQQQQYEQQIEQLRTNRTKLAKEIINEVKELEIDLGDGKVAKYKIGEEESKALQKDILEIENFFTQFQNEDGTLNKERFLLSYIAASNPTKLAKVLTGYGEGEGRGKVIKDDFKNNTMQPKGKGTTTASREFTGDDHISKITRAAKDGKIDLSQAW